MLSQRPNHSPDIQKYRRNTVRAYRPFWLPASNFYVLTAAVSIAFFFLVWWILHEGNEELPWIPAGITACLVVIGAVFLREIILKKARKRYLLAQHQLDRNIDKISLNSGSFVNPNKITLQQNAAILKEIEKKSEAAQILNSISSGHYEVFEMCNDYLSLNEREMQTVNIGSPRIAALRRGRDIVNRMHRFHLLKWAEIETKRLNNDSNSTVSFTEKVEATQKTLAILDKALRFYPHERSLVDSKQVLLEVITSIKVANWIEKAERAAFKGNNKRAISFYRDALFYLGRENVTNNEKDLIAQKIKTEIEKIRQLETQNNINKRFVDDFNESENL